MDLRELDGKKAVQYYIELFPSADGDLAIRICICISARDDQSMCRVKSDLLHTDSVSADVNLQSSQSYDEGLETSS